MRNAPATVGALLLALPILLGAKWPEWATSATETADLERYADEDAVVVLEEWRITLKGGERTGERRRVVHVLTDDGRHAALLALPSNSFERYGSVRVWIRQPGGETSRFSDDDGTLLGVSDLNTLDDTSLLVLDPPGLVPGSTVAVECRFERVAERPQDLFRIQESIPVIRASVSVDARGGFRTRARVAYGRNPGPDQATEAGVWEFRDLPALPSRGQPYSPAPPATTLALDYVPPEGASPFDTWDSTARWAAKLFALPDRSRPALDAAVAELRSSSEDVVDAVGRVARRVRYYAIELGSGGYVPRPPEKTFERSLGDCKDKAQLMIAMLRGAGVESYPVLAIAPSHGHVPEDLPSPYQFDHAIVAIPWTGRDTEPGMAVVDDPVLGRLRFYDATLPDSSPQDIDPLLEGGAALVARAAASRLLRLPGSPPEDNVLVREFALKLAPDGSLQASVEVHARGAMRLQYAGEHGERIRPDELRQSIYERLSTFLPLVQGLEVDGFSDDADGAWSFAFRVSSDLVLADFGSVRVLELGPLMGLDALPLPPADDAEPAHLPMQGIVREVWTVEYDGWKAIGLTPPLEVVNEQGHSRLECRREPGRIHIVRELGFGALEVPTERRQDLLALRAGLERLNSVSAVFEP